jgi:hypothetical protein
MVVSQVGENGWKYQVTRAPNAAVATARTTARSTSLGSAQRQRAKPWVQAYRKVPVSSSRASTGAPGERPDQRGQHLQQDAEVKIGNEQDTVTIEVTDNGTGQNGNGSPGGGHGLAGMRERAAVFGGELAAGPRSGGGFAVRARMPLSSRLPPGELS